MTVEKNRTIRPSSRKESSLYKIDLSKREKEENVHITITHENEQTYKKEYFFSAQQLQGKKSIHFKWDGENIIWKDISE